MRTLTSLILGTCTAILISHPAPAATAVIGQSITGDLGLKSINVISFAPGGILLIGDGAASQILAVVTGDTKPSPSRAKTIPDFDKQLAGHLGTTPDGIEIIDLAVNPASGKIYVALRKQDDKSYLVATVDAANKIREFEMDKVPYARTRLSAGQVQISRITDVAWADDRLIAAGRGNETFASKIFSIAAPLEHDATSNFYSAETYHVQHRRWETKAPMSVLLPIQEDGQTYVVGAFSCTPVVKYPIDSLKPGAKVKGTSVLELGSGNRPIDMFNYVKDGKPFVLTNTFRFHHERRPFGPSPYWTVKFEQGILSEKDAVNEKALQRLVNWKPATDRVEVVQSFHGVMHMDKLNEDSAVVLRQSEKGLRLETLPLP